MDAQLKNESEKIMDMTLHVAHRLSKSWAPSKVGWSDSLLLKLCSDLEFSPSAYSRNELKNILTRFYYLYFLGLHKAEDNVHATLNDVIAIAQTDHGPIWVAPPPNANAFYIPNVSKTEDILFEMTHNVCYDSYDKQFCDHVLDIIGSINPLFPENSSETGLIQLTSFLALTLYRFASNNKTLYEMGRTFVGTQYKNDLISLAGWPADAPFSPPCNKCLIVCEEAIIKGLWKTSKIFSMVVYAYFFTINCCHFDTSTRMFAAALLNDTALVGLDLVRMMENVTVILDIEWRDLLRKTYFKGTRSSWDRIAQFLIRQNNKKHPQYTFYWAKIIDDDYFRELALNENLFLATIFGAIIEKVEGQGVWQAEWAQKTVLSEDAKSIGRALYQKSKQALV